jgi:tripartite ATP-independent transporter DctM subunit
MGPGEVAAIMFGIFGVLIFLRVPVSFSLGVACLPILYFDDRLSPILLITEMNKAFGGFVLLAVPFFILAANLMNHSGITARLVDLSRALVGHFRGGLGHINVVVSMFFAGISGSSTAEAAGIGSLLIPAMKKQGYDSSFTVALIACSAVMGVIIPPSILMVVWGGIMSVSIGALFLSGFLPGVMIGLSQMVCVYIYATRRGYPVYARASFRDLFVNLGRASFALFAPLIVVGGVVGGIATPTEASVLAVLYTLLVGLGVYRSIGPRELPKVFYETARLASISLFCVGTASAFGFVLAFYRIPKLLMGFLAPYATSVTAVGLIVAGVFLVVGCFIDAIPAMIIFGGLMQPLAEHVHMHPVHFAIIGVVSLAFGLVTPPYGLCLLISCAIGGIEVRDCILDIAIILIPMLGVLLFIVLFPQAILFFPRLIMPKFV